MKKTRYRRQASNGSKQMSFLPEPDFNPKLPSKNTLTFKTLYLLLRGKKISHLDFQDETGSWRLAAYVDKLNKLGWPIETNNVAHLSNIGPKKRQISQYFLSKKIIQKIKKGGGGYV